LIIAGTVSDPVFQRLHTKFTQPSYTDQGRILSPEVWAKAARDLSRFWTNPCRLRARGHAAPDRRVACWKGEMMRSLPRRWAAPYGLPAHWQLAGALGSTRATLLMTDWRALSKAGSRSL